MARELNMLASLAHGPSPAPVKPHTNFCRIKADSEGAAVNGSRSFCILVQGNSQHKILEKLVAVSDKVCPYKQRRITI
ncbi:MAG: hypothetical protein ACLTXL_14170 [Clostridia bacterium]